MADMESLQIKLAMIKQQRKNHGTGDQMMNDLVYFPPSKRKQMQMLRDQGLKHREIAEIIGCTRQYVAQVCSKRDPNYFIPVGDECIYPNLRNWMNENKVTRKELLRRMGYTEQGENYERLRKIIRGKQYPNKRYIDKMLEATGMTYEILFYTEAEDG